MVKKEKYIEPMAKSWVEDATKLIKFKDDRLRVQAELLDHIEDATDAWKDAGYDDYEAKKKAVSNMGDAAEVANNLADIYRPFWGRLWKLTKIIRNLLIIWLILVFIDNYYEIKWILTYDYNDKFFIEQSEIIYDNKPDIKTEIEGYKIKLKRVQAIDCELKDKKFVRMALEITSINPLKRYPSFVDSLTAEDDRGNIYPQFSHFFRRDYTEDRWAEAITSYVETSDEHLRPGKTYLYVELYLPYNAQNVTLYFNRFGQCFELDILVGGGE